MNKADAWKRQRQLKKEDIPTQAQVAKLANNYTDPQEKALFLMAYLTAGRITEIIPKKYLIKNIYKKAARPDKRGEIRHMVVYNENGSPTILEKLKVDWNYPGITPANITWEEREDGNKALIISMQNRKNKKFQRKNIPVPYHREQELIDQLMAYVSTVPETQTLFPFCLSKAQKIINKSGMNPHYLRDIRLTHLVTIYHFPDQRLVQFAGWANSLPAQRYVRLSTADLIDGFK